MTERKGVQHPTVDDVLPLALHLTPADKLTLIQRLAAAIAEEVTPLPPKPKRSLLGAYAELGPAPSEEDIAEARREMWASTAQAAKDPSA